MVVMRSHNVLQDGWDAANSPADEQQRSRDPRLEAMDGDHTDASQEEAPHPNLVTMEEEEASLQQDLWRGQEEASSFAQASPCKNLQIAGCMHCMCRQ